MTNLISGAVEIRALLTSPKVGIGIKPDLRNFTLAAGLSEHSRHLASAHDR